VFPRLSRYVPDGVQKLLTAEAAEHAENNFWLSASSAPSAVKSSLGGSRVDRPE